MARSVVRVLEAGGLTISGALLQFGDKFGKYSQPRFFSNEFLKTDKSRPPRDGNTAASESADQKRAGAAAMDFISPPDRNLIQVKENGGSLCQTGSRTGTEITQSVEVSHGMETVG